MMLDPHDHRRIGSQLDLFHMEEEAPGMVFWHPRGLALVRQLEEAIRCEMRLQGLQEVRSPQLLRQAVWEASGHWQHFREHMFVVDDERVAALKPVSCPAHLMMAKQRGLSHRDLPLRYGELGVVHRAEKSGVLHGLFRLRQFSQDDGHIVCRPEQVVDEVARFCDRLRAFYAAFDLAPVAVGFSSRPKERMGSDSEWDRAEGMLRAAASRVALDLVEQPGEGAFYGPKLEFVLQDRLDRRWQCGTIQLDMVMPERFDVSFVDEAGRRQRPALLHRAVCGSLERFLGIVLEHWAGMLPPWLAPEQVRVLPVAAGQHHYAEHVARVLDQAELRATIDCRDESLGKRVLAAHQLGVPYVLVVGPREAAAEQASLREGNNQRVLELADAVAEIRFAVGRLRFAVSGSP